MATGSLKQRSKGSWSLIFDLSPDPATGKRRQKRMTVKGTKKEAEKIMRETLSSIDGGAYIKPEKMTVAQYLNQWLDTYVEPNLSATTSQGYKSIVRHHLIPGLGNTLLQRLEPSHIAKFYSDALESGLSNKTVLNTHRLLSRALNQAVKMQIIVRNPAQAVEPPRYRPKEMSLITDKQMDAFMEEIEGSPFREAFLLSIYTGLRRGELLGLRWRDINLEFATITVNQSLVRVAGKGFIIKEPKTASSRRSIAITPFVCNMLRAAKGKRSQELNSLGGHISENDLIFCRLDDGRPFEPSSMSHAFKRIMRKTNCEGIRLHDLRHYHASWLLREGVNIKVIQQRLGHSNIGTTLNIYGHIMPDQDAEAAMIFERGIMKRRDTVRDHFVTKIEDSNASN